MESKDFWYMSTCNTDLWKTIYLVRISFTYFLSWIKFIHFLNWSLYWIWIFSDVPPDQKPLDWFTRMKVALGAAKGLEYLHDKANPPVIYRDLKSSNILLDKDFNAKLSDFGLAKLGTGDDKIHVSSRVMGTYGYCAPEYQRTGQLTLKSDIYSFGVVLLELITGRRVIDPTKPAKEQNLINWVSFCHDLIYRFLYGSSNF